MTTATYKTAIDEVYHQAMESATPQERSLYERYQRASLHLSSDTPPAQRLAIYAMEDQLDALLWYQVLKRRIDEVVQTHFGR